MGGTASPCPRRQQSSSWAVQRTRRGGSEVRGECGRGHLRVGPGTTPEHQNQGPDAGMPFPLL